MKLAEREEAQHTLVRLLSQAYGDEDRKMAAADTAVSLSSLIEGIPQATLARRVHRSRTVIAYLVKAGVLRRDQHGHVRSLDAAFAEIALARSGNSRNLLTRVVEVSDWFNELRDPAFVQGLQHDASGKVVEFSRPQVSPEERESRKQAFLEAQSAAAKH